MLVNWNEVCKVEIPLIFTLQRILCVKHGEPFRNLWPLGFASFSIRAWDRLCTNLDFGEECGGDKERIEPLLDIKPICCRLSNIQLVAVYRECPISVLARCEGCGQKKDGSTFSMQNHWGRVKQFKHMCFDCVVNRIVTFK